MKEYNIKSIRQEFKQKGIFYTQKELALYLKGFLPDDVSEVYDPTCGNGGLLSVFDDGVEKYGQDIEEAQVEEAGRLPNFHGAVGDTLTEPAFLNRRFKYVIANPPFSIKWTPIQSEIFDGWPCLPPKSKSDYAFIAHILHVLSDDGMAVVLGFPGILYRGNAEGKIRQWLVEQNYIDTVVSVDGGHFVDTKIATCVLILKKQRPITDIRFVHNDLSVTASRDEVEKNNFNLSVNQYIIEQPEREEIDPIALETQARQSFLSKLEKELEFEKMVCEIERIDMKPFLEDLKRIIQKYEVTP